MQIKAVDATRLLGFLSPLFIALVAILLLVVPVRAAESVFRIAIMQAEKGAAKKYRSLESFLSAKGIQVQFIGAKSYTAAAEMFARGEVDGMFSGSGVAGTMIIKDLAYPVLRPVDREGHSTYWAVVIAPKGAPEFTASADYLRKKRVLATSLASSGEFFFRAIPGIKSSGADLLPAVSHSAAVDALSKGAADLAIVKNRVWESMKDKYPDLRVVGQDTGENPDGTLIVSKTADRKLVDQVTAALFALEEDETANAREVREEMGIRGYIETSTRDFDHTLALLRKAGVNSSFNFEF